ncbi:hypothetical protein CLCR_00989 [Cladophialophora carrionii]|uniref:Uncharacterized protein n=1 Tax=Cladophialophora carrionii TaxID=86049 RepID=A0A1C1D1C5_9EURO|nr:hypothetical protein CLCR_00989 [Cladophialophora carrionii]
MGHQKSSSKLLLERGLGPTDRIAIRFIHGKRPVRRDNDPEGRSANVTSQEEKDRKEMAAVGELDEEMDMMTDPELLHFARADQEGERAQSPWPRPETLIEHRTQARNTLLHRLGRPVIEGLGRHTEHELGS